MNRYLRSICIAIIIIASIIPLSAQTVMPKIFGSGMVIQQEKPIIVWGFDAPGTAVTVSFAGKDATATANDKGEWKVTLPAMKADGVKYTMAVSGSSKVTFDNILIGEVWLCSGQSNMEMGIKACLNADAEIAAADFPNIRLFMVPKKYTASTEKDVVASWKVCTPANVADGGWGGFSAAGYYFGREIFKKKNIPVGLIESAWGGTRIEPWTPPSGFASVPALQGIYTQSLASDPRSDLHKDRFNTFLGVMKKWVIGARDRIDREEVITDMPTFPPELLPPGNQQAPSVLYNAMLHPIVPFAIRGMLWYQGEANCSEGMLYLEKKKALIGGLRALYGYEFPFYFVQIAPYGYGSQAPNILPEFWEAVAAVPKAIPNTGMAVIYDVGDTKDIHPKNKQEVGRRLALLALANTYGDSTLVCSGPVFKAMEISGNTLRITFDSVGGGLASRDGKPLSYFEIIDGNTGGFENADAVIEGLNTVVVSSPKAPSPVAVRFGWHKLAEPNLMNKEGLPAVQFRAGKVPVRDALVMSVPEAKDYQLVYDCDLAKAGATIAYTADNSKSVTRPFDRIAYFLELTEGSQTKWVYVSMEAFTDDISKIGIPALSTKANFQQMMTSMNVYSSEKDIVSGTGLKGNIEFWPNNYGGQNSKNIPNASATAFDFGDGYSDPLDGYGSMQVHNYEAKQVIFAVNNWKSGSGGDLGIGNGPAPNIDWTFAKNAAKYSAKRIRVLVHLK